MGRLISVEREGRGTKEMRGRDWYKRVRPRTGATASFIMFADDTNMLRLYVMSPVLFYRKNDSGTHQYCISI